MGRGDPADRDLVVRGRRLVRFGQSDRSISSFARLEAPSFEPATAILYVIGGLLSAGIEYYANLGPVGGWLPPAEQEHYLFEVINVLAWKHVRLNVGLGEGLSGASNDFVGKMILGFR